MKIQLPKIKTWYIESGVVATILLIVWLSTGCKPIELLGSIAIFCTFSHTSISERLREKEKQKTVPGVSCYRKLIWYLIVKEACWFAYFILVHAWSALIGCTVFLIYPLWRKFWRKIHPMKNEEENGIS